MWGAIHTVCLGAPETLNDEEQAQYRQFFESLIHVLPCNTCREHLKQNLEKVPLVLGTRDELFAWSVKIHNTVNEMLDKRARFTVDEAKQFWMNGGWRASDASARFPIWQKLLLAVALALIVYAIYIVVSGRGRNSQKRFSH
jgi:hypothetical protein